jgi:hypothetical protein
MIICESAEKAWELWNTRATMNGWIDVNDRMPPAGDDVLVTVEWSSGDHNLVAEPVYVIEACYHLQYTDIGPAFPASHAGWYDAHDQPIEDGYETVTAWQPKPQPYRRGQTPRPMEMR